MVFPRELVDEVANAPAREGMYQEEASAVFEFFAIGTLAIRGVHKRGFYPLVFELPERSSFWASLVF